MRVAAVVLNYRHWPATLDVVHALARQTTPPTRVVVVDNGSGRDEAAAIQHAATGGEAPFEALTLPDNAGYAAGMNAGVRALTVHSVDAVLLLTHDCVLEADCLELLIAELTRHPATGVAAPVLGWKGREGVTWSAGGALRSLSGTPYHPHKGLPLQDALTGRSRAVDWADGAALLVRREVLDEVGPLPEQYFLYFEEVDFQGRVRRSERDVRIVSGALAWQEPGHTPAYLAARNQMLWLRGSRRRAVPFFLFSVVVAVAREVAKVALGRDGSLRRALGLLLGVVDGVTGRLRRELFRLG